jgi:hypothetical protein
MAAALAVFDGIARLRCAGIRRPSFSYLPGVHRGLSYGRRFHRLFFVVGADLRFYDWAYDDYGVGAC